MQRVCLGNVSWLHKTIVFAFILMSVLLTGCGKGKSSSNITANSGEAMISNKLAAIVATGDPVTREQLDSWYAEPPAGENAADIYGQAFAALTGDSGSPAFLAKNQNAIGLLLQAADRKACRYPIDLKMGFATALPHLQKIKMSAQLLNMAANDAIAKGRTDTAIRMIEANIRLARSLEDEPIIISRLVADASLALAHQPVEQLLCRGGLTDGQLVELSQASHEADELASFRRAVVGERAAIISGFQATTEEWQAMNVNEAMETNVPDLAAYKKTDTYYRDFNFALDAMNALVDRADKSYPEALTVTVVKPDAKYVLSKMLVPQMENALSRPAETAARLHIVQAALAVERYRLAHANALPSTLEELTPGLLSVAATDPFDGKPRRFKPQPGKGYTIYSIGRDKVDDGGKRQTTTKTGVTGDVTFTVTR